MSVGIVGFTSVGRLILRQGLDEGLNITAIISPEMDVSAMAKLFKDDPSNGPFPGEVRANEGKLEIDGVSIAVVREKAPQEWKKVGVTHLVDARGVCTREEATKRMLATADGVKRVLLSAHQANVPLIMPGVNHSAFADDERIYFVGTPVASSLAVLCNILHGFFGGVESCKVTSFHCCSDRSNSTAQVSKVLESMSGKMTSTGLHSPIPSLSLVRMDFKMKKATLYDDVCKKLKELSSTELESLLSYTESVLDPEGLRGKNRTLFTADEGKQLGLNGLRLAFYLEEKKSHAKNVTAAMAFLLSKDAE